MFRRMPGSSHNLDLKCAHINNRIFIEWLMVEAKSCSSAGADDRTGLICDLAITRNKVGVQMGIQNMRQCKTKLGRGMQVSVHVSKRVDQYPFLRIVRSDQIGRVAESGIYKWFDEI